LGRPRPARARRLATAQIGPQGGGQTRRAFGLGRGGRSGVYAGGRRRVGVEARLVCVFGRLVHEHSRPRPKILIKHAFWAWPGRSLWLYGRFLSDPPP